MRSFDISKIKRGSNLAKKLGLDKKSEEFFKASAHLKNINNRYND
jgi:hypothetical protein